jgi:hypothetical protein
VVFVDDANRIVDVGSSSVSIPDSPAAAGLRSPVEAQLHDEAL